MTVIESLERMQIRDDVPEFRPGDTVRVHFQVIEGQRRRVQVFEGTVIKRQGASSRETFTVRKQSFGVGVERTFPVHSPKIEKIERVCLLSPKRVANRCIEFCVNQCYKLKISLKQVACS